MSELEKQFKNHQEVGWGISEIGYRDSEGHLS